MSIRPIDHNVMIPKSQEVSSVKQTEHVKNRNIVESEFIQQEKIIKYNRQKVLDTEKSTNNKIKDEEQSNREGNLHKRKRRKKDKLLVEEEAEDLNKDLNKGYSIDIRI